MMGARFAFRKLGIIHMLSFFDRPNHDAAHAGNAQAGNTHCRTVTLTFIVSEVIAKNQTASSASSLFLLGLSLLSLGLGALLALTQVASLGAGLTEGLVGVLGGLVVADGALLELSDVLDGQGSGGAADKVVTALGGLDVLGGGVTLLGLSVAAGEEDEALPVLLETLDVGLEALLGEVLAAGVDGDTDGAGELAGDTGGCSC